MSDTATIVSKTPRRKADKARAESAPATPTPLLEWQDVPTSELAPYAPDPSIPMAAYAVTTVMAWAVARGNAGAIPTWEVGNGTWGVIVVLPHSEVSTIQIPLSALPSFATTDVAAWGQAVARWGAANGHGLAIPTFQTDGASVTALVFASGYPGLASYDAPNTELFQSLSQPRKLADFSDPAVWANAVMRVGQAKGFFAAWPTWEHTTKRGLVGMAQFDPGPLPDASDTNVQNVLTILDKTIETLQISTADALATFAGVYATFNEAPIVDPGLQILTDVVFGAVQIAVNLIPGVGGAVGALISTAVTVAQDAAKAGGGEGPTTLQTYQTALLDATNATIKYVSTAHDRLLDAQQNGTLQQAWSAPYTSPLSQQTMQLGMLANASTDVVHGDSVWTRMATSLTSQLNLNLETQITAQLYAVERRTYANAPPTKQWWYGTIDSVIAPKGDCAAYIASSADDMSCWFTDFVQEPGHARGPYVTATEFWLQAISSGLPAYPPTDLVQALFSSDGFGTTYNGAFEKSAVYDGWLMSTDEIGSDGAFLQQWRYPQTGDIVTVTLVDTQEGFSTLVGKTDAYGNLTLSRNSTSGFQQQVIVNFLGRLN